MNDIIVQEPKSQAVIVQDSSSAVLEMIAKAARDPSIDINKMTALFDLQERLIKKNAESAFNQAYTRLLRKLPRVKKNGLVEYPEDKNKPDGKKKKAFNFAKWEDMDEAIRPLLQEEGFSISFNCAPRQGDGGGAIITGTLMHEAGHTLSASIPLALDTSGGKNNIQGMGSTFSYGKRYTTTMLLNIVTQGEDDDGVRGGIEYIQDDQVAHIKKLIADTGTDELRFLQTMGLASVENISKGEITVILNMLMTKKKAQDNKNERPPV